LLIAVLDGSCVFAEALPGDGCGSAPPQPAFCSAVRGVPAEGWPAQSRSEVLAQHGMVVTSQPLAAQAGLQILMRGGNAIDAAVATAAINGGEVGGVQSIMYIAEPGSSGRGNGYYRSGSDFRKDGQAVGW
jgi:gamma-glutamyltranspeptidase